MRFATDNGSYAIAHVEDGELILDNIKSLTKGDGRLLMEQVKSEAIALDVPLTLYAYPQDDSISIEGLRSFYYSCGLELHQDDTDHNYFAYNQ